jgi:RNase P subunit RPR2
LKDRGFPVATKHTKHRELRFTETFVSNLMRDPFYAGAMVFGDGIVNLFEQYDFVPAVDVADFERIRGNEGIRRDYKLTEIIKQRGEIKADLMRGMIICGHCGRTMATGLTSKKLPDGVRHYFYYRCDTIDCKAKGKSVRAKVIMEAAYAFLKKYPLATNKGYARYVKEMERVLAEKGTEVDRDIKRFTTQRQHEERRVADMKELIAAIRFSSRSMRSTSKST